MPLWPKEKVLIRVVCADHGEVWQAEISRSEAAVRSILGMFHIEETVFKHSRAKHDFGRFDVLVYRGDGTKKRLFGRARYFGSSWGMNSVRQYPPGRIPKVSLRGESS